MRPLTCNYCVSALCLHWANLSSACVKAKGGNFEHNLPPKKPLINSD